MNRSMRYTEEGERPRFLGEPGEFSPQERTLVQLHWTKRRMEEFRDQHLDLLDTHEVDTLNSAIDIVWQFWLAQASNDKFGNNTEANELMSLLFADNTLQAEYVVPTEDEVAAIETADFVGIEATKAFFEGWDSKEDPNAESWADFYNAP